MKRPAVTLIEILIAILIIGILFGIFVVAVVVLRKKSNEMVCKNSLRQIVLGHVGLSTLDPEFYPGGVGDLPVLSPYPNIYKYLGYPIVDPSESNGYQMVVPEVSMIKCPSDPTLVGIPKDAYFTERTSYPYNALVFKPNTIFPNSILDGTANTIGFSERYSKLVSSEYLITVASSPKGLRVRPATFSDLRHDDNHPIHDPFSKACLGSATGKTFLVQPDPKAAPGSELITGHPGGIPVGYLDGSVRVFNRDVTPVVFWAQVTPDRSD